ncbi:MAG: hypothetical protein IIB83_04110 [Bacteroidetes bacterium]|nr:hypothetical protein [Bacteroidota bacterium]
MKVGLLVNTVKELEFKNTLILTNALLRCNHLPILILEKSLCINNRHIKALCSFVKDEMGYGSSILEDSFHYLDINSIDYIWVLSFGLRSNFLDTIEILWILEKSGDVSFINSVESLMYYSNKYILTFLPDFIKIPETYASCNFEYLYKIFQAGSREEWILKPPAESMGRNVFMLRKGDLNAKALLQMLTGNNDTKFCILQEFIQDIREKGEKRVIFAKNKVVGCYTRSPQADNHRTNLHQGSEPLQSELNPEEKDYCQKMAKYFSSIGINFVGIDMVYPYIIEINVVNPGGLNTIYELTGNDISDNIVRLLIDKKNITNHST